MIGQLLKRRHLLSIIMTTDHRHSMLTATLGKSPSFRTPSTAMKIALTTLQATLLALHAEHEHGNEFERPSRSLCDGDLPKLKTVRRELLFHLPCDLGLWSVSAVLTPETPKLHSLFEKKNDALFSSRFLFALGTCASLVLLIASVVLGVLLSAAERLEELIRVHLIDRFNLPQIFVAYADVVANDIRIAGTLACFAGFLMVIVVCLMTMSTYKKSVLACISRLYVIAILMLTHQIYALRQRKSPFRVDPTTYNASFYVGHQLSHFLLSFFICLVIVAILWVIGRVLYLFEFIRVLVWRALVSVLVPAITNYAVQFVYVTA